MILVSSLTSSNVTSWCLKTYVILMPVMSHNKLACPHKRLFISYPARIQLFKLMCIQKLIYNKNTRNKTKTFQSY